MGNPACKKCGKAADSPMAYKCDTCGAESATHDPSHGCGAGHCVIKCSGCKLAETLCTCA